VGKGRSYHHGDLRRALIEATIRLVDRHGQDRFTLRAAAKLAGVSDGAPYHHFADKDALLSAVATEGFRMLRQEMERARDTQPGAAKAKGTAIAVAYVLFAAKHPSHFRIMFRRPLRNDDGPELAEAADETLRLLRVGIQQGVKQNGLKRGDRTMNAIWALLHGLSCLVVDGHLGIEGRDPKRLTRLVWDTLRSLDA
jgi:AcrR family transcriptional regulator